MANIFRTKQLSYWAGEFGNSYIARNSELSFFGKRRKFFEKILVGRDINSVLEIGCNIGANLSLLREINPTIELTGIEPNKKAVLIARKSLPDAKIIHDDVFSLPARRKYDLVFTAGVLIHIADKDLKAAIKKIIAVSNRYVLAIEYYSKRTQGVPYRGLSDALFKRPYDKEYLTLYPSLKKILGGTLRKVEGFDNCKYWLFEK